MAKQKGAHKILGTIGELTYYKTKDGYLIREGSPITASRIQSDPAFAQGSHCERVSRYFTAICK